MTCTNEPNVSIPQLANLLIERTQHVTWTVVFKSLITIHHLMCFGNDKFTQYLATSNHSFNLADFMDRTTPQGYSMSTFVRRYSKYVDEKCISYRTLAIDLCKIRSGNDNVLRTMNMDKLSKTLPIVQAQFDALLEFAADQKDLNNGIILCAFRLLYKDLVRIYVAYQEAIINLLERYFKLSRKKTREALELYKNYLTRMDRVASFLKVVDAVGLDKSEMPDLTRSPASIVNALEDHLAQLEAKKRGRTTPGSPDGNEENEDNKENNDPKAEDREEKPSVSSAPQEATGSGGSAERHPPKPAPPQKPARPSPSPEVSPAKPETKQGPERAAPPERPAKPPPSRPPPPSATGATASPGGSTAGTGAQNKPVGQPAPPPPPKPATPTPPPHPPPPSHTHGTTSHSPVPAPSTGSSELQKHEENLDKGASSTHVEPRDNPSDDEQKQIENNQPEDPPRDVQDSSPSSMRCSSLVNQPVEQQQNAHPEEPTTNGNESNHTGSGAANDSCSAEIGSEVQSIAAPSEVNEIRENHINGTDGSDQVQHVGVDDEMPPPPPPIEDVEEEQAPAVPVEGERLQSSTNGDINGDHREQNDTE